MAAEVLDAARDARLSGVHLGAEHLQSPVHVRLRLAGEAFFFRTVDAKPLKHLSRSEPACTGRYSCVTGAQVPSAWSASAS